MLEKIFLIRHAQSDGNADHQLHRTMADQDVPLSALGVEQAHVAAERLALHYQTYTPDGYVKMWASPYRRTRETAKIIGEESYPRNPCRELELPHVEENRFGTNYTESLYMTEQQFGLFDGLSDEERAQQYPREWAYFQKVALGQFGRLYAKMPMGESAFDVVVRTHMLEELWARDCTANNISDLIVVTHGVTAKAILVNLLKETPEWFESEVRPNNASIRLLVKSTAGTWRDKGYIFKGYHKDGRPA